MPNESDEILVENEPWTGLVVVRHHPSMAMREAGAYGLVQAGEWYQKDPTSKTVTVWRGPDKPDEQIPRADLEPEDCQTVLVDEQGYYTCPPIIDLLREEVWKLAQEMFQEEADRRTAETQSYLHDSYTEKYGDELFIEANFGDAIAVNGDTVYGAKAARPPRGYVKLEEEGGRYPSGEEEEIEFDYIVEGIVRQLGDKYQSLDEKAVSGIIAKEAGTANRYVYWTSDSGHVNFWISKKALKAYEKAVAAEQERQRKMRHGGFPFPQDWSPKGGFPPFKPGQPLL